MNGLSPNKSIKEYILNAVIGGGKIIQFLETMRKVSYFKHSWKSKFSLDFVRFVYYRRKYNRLGILLGMSITYDSLGYGVVIPHYGNIVVGPNKIGNYAVLFPDTNISGNHKTIGDGLYLSTGAKITRKVVIGNNVSICANSVVTADCGDNVLLAGMPAFVKKSNYPSWYERDSAIDKVNKVETLKKEMNIT